MPSLDEIKAQPSKRKFKKREYRAWDMDGTGGTGTADAAQNNEEASKPIKAKNIEVNDRESSNEIVYEIDPQKIENWKFHDRPEAELGDIDALAKDFLSIGQQQPCIVRRHPTDSDKYELIVGERRWRAAKKANLNVIALVKALDDTEAALIQAAENDNRKDLSDYAKGMSFSKQIESGVISQSDLTDRLGFSKQKVSRLLSFSKIDEDVIQAVADWSKVSSGTAEKIKQLCVKGDEYKNAILSLATKIASGNVGHNKLSLLVSKKLANDSERPFVETNQVRSVSGRHYFTWRKDNNGRPSIHFPNDILNVIMIDDNRLDSISKKIVEVLENEIEKNT